MSQISLNKTFNRELISLISPFQAKGATKGEVRKTVHHLLTKGRTTLHGSRQKLRRRSRTSGVHPDQDAGSKMLFLHRVYMPLKLFQ